MIDGTGLTQEKFLADVKDHGVTILRDDGLYRHIRAESTGDNKWNMWFEVVTWPGCIAYHGDMGSFMFSRIDDMFCFFRGKDINPGYWAEKVVSESIFGEGIRGFSVEEFRENVLSDVRDRLDLDEDAEIPDDVADEIEILLNCEDEWGCVQTMRDFHSNLIEFPDFWEHKCTRGTLHYIWCCFAINWAVGEYDKLIDERNGGAEA